MAGNWKEQFEWLNYLSHIIIFIRSILFWGKKVQVKLQLSGQERISAPSFASSFDLVHKQSMLSFLLWSAEERLCYVLLGLQKQSCLARTSADTEHATCRTFLLLTNHSTRHCRFLPFALGHPCSCGVLQALPFPDHPSLNPQSQPEALVVDPKGHFVGFSPVPFILKEPARWQPRLPGVPRAVEHYL